MGRFPDSSAQRLGLRDAWRLRPITAALLIAGLAGLAGCGSHGATATAAAPPPTEPATPIEETPEPAASTASPNDAEPNDAEPNPQTPSAHPPVDHPATDSEGDAQSLPFETWVGGVAHFYHLEGASFVANHKTVAIERGGRFLQDGMISSRGEPCRDFAAFAGTWPGAAWALADSWPESTRLAALLRWRKDRWVRQRALPGQYALLAQWPEGAALLLTAPRKAARPSYQLHLLGAATSTTPRPTRAPAGAPCATALVHPKEMLTNARGDLALLGRACAAPHDASSDASSNTVEHWAPGSTQSVLYTFPDDVELHTITLTESGDLWAAGSRRAPEPNPPAGYIARLVAGSAEDQPAPPRAVLSLAVPSSGPQWAVVDAANPELPGDREKHIWTLAPPTNAWRLVPSWASRATGYPVSLHTQRDLVWLQTEQALLLRKGRRADVSKPPSWLSDSCHETVTNARPYTYRKVTGPVPIQTRMNGNLVGPDCPHFYLIESTREPNSELFKQVMGELEDRLGRLTSRYPRMVHRRTAFELGTFHFGIKVPDLQMRWHVRRTLKAHFPNVREVCASPIDIGEDAITRTTAAPPPR